MVKMTVPLNKDKILKKLTKNNFLQAITLYIQDSIDSTNYFLKERPPHHSSRNSSMLRRNANGRQRPV